MRTAFKITGLGFFIFLAGAAMADLTDLKNLPVAVMVAGAALSIGSVFYAALTAD